MYRRAECKWEKVFVDWVPYGMGNTAMYTSECQYNGDIEPGDDCGEKCPAFEPAPEERDPDRERDEAIDSEDFDKSEFGD
jgi:hypothetical protein